VDRGVKKVIVLSTDKAVSPVNLYGATKLAAEKIFIAANAYGGTRVKFSIVRYGNVIGSRGSVIPLFLKLKSENKLDFPITDEQMTRFWITLEQGVALVIKALEESEGGEIFVPIIPSMKLTDLARVIEPKCSFKIIGIRPGEKIHEILFSEDEARKTKKFQGMYVVLPQFIVSTATENKYASFPSVPEGFVYKSDTNDQVLSVAELKKIIDKIPVD